MRWYILSLATVVATVAGVNLYIENLATTQPDALRFNDGFWFTVWAVFGGIAWAPALAFALYSLLRSPAGRNRGGEG